MDEGLSFSDIFDDDIPYEQKPPEMLRPMEEDDFPTQTKDKFGGLWENDLLTETHLQDLYHATGEHSLLGMLEDNAIKLSFVGGTQADEFYNKGYPFFLSTMRQKYGNYAHDIGGEHVGNKYNVIVHLDGAALTAAGYKHFPMDYWSHGPQYSEQEERIVSNKDEIKPLKKFVKDIHVYIPKNLKHPFTIDTLHKINDLAPTIGVPVYFYPSEALGYFRSHRPEMAVRDVNQILQPAQFSPEDLEHLEWRKQNKSRVRESYLDSFIRIYKGDYSKVDEYPDKNLLRMMLYYEYDLYPALFAAAHNDKPNHLPIFREIAAAIKKEGVKSFKDLITIVMNRERDRLNRENDIREVEQLNESEELNIGDKNYDFDSRYAFALFEIYPTFWVCSQTKNGRSKFHSDNRRLEKELDQFNDKYKVHVHQRLWMMLDKIKISAGIPDIEYTKGSKKNITGGRIWGIQGKIYVSFWDKLSIVKPVFDEVEEILKEVKADGQPIDQRKALYIFGGSTTDENVMTYDEVKGKETADVQTDDDVLLNKLIHLSPEVKKGLLNVGSDRMQYYSDKLGISVVQLKQLMGSLDEVEMAIPPNEPLKKGRSLGHGRADSIFTLYGGGLIVGMQELPAQMIFFSNSDVVENALNIFDFQKFIPPGEDRDLQLTHTHLMRLTQSAVRRSKIIPVDVSRKGEISGRIWKFNNTNGVSVIGFWQSIDEVRKYWKQMLWIFDKLKVDYKIAQYTFNNHIYKKYTYLDIVGKTQGEKVDKNEVKLMMMIHNSPQIKKKLIGMQPNQLSNYADNINIPLIKLKQMLGSMDESFITEELKQWMNYPPAKASGFPLKQ